MKKALVARAPIGIFAFSGSDLLYYKLWNPKRAIDSFLSKDMDPDFKTNLAGYEIEESPEAYRVLRKHIREYAKSLCGFSDAQFNSFISEFSVALTTRRLQGSIGRDKLIVQAVRSLDDLTRAINVFNERLYEWYSLHYPEIKNVNIVEIVAKQGHRENVKGFRSSVGVDLGEEDEKALREFAFTIQNLEREKKMLEEYIEKATSEAAKNFASLIDPILAARLMAYAGSLEKISRMPASTIQLLGAEKALFRHLHEKGKSPKYGMIYNSTLIQSAPKELKGKVARVLSSKLMLAARIDYYSGRDETEKLKRELGEELKKIGVGK
jgi:nucleolar protein 56